MSEKPHILVVDDEPAIRFTLETGLALKGFRVTAASGGCQALDYLKSEKFDAMVCDLIMPDGDGVSVIKSLREFDPHLPVILVTAQGSVEAAYASINMGASDFIAKPFELAHLAGLLHRLLEARDLRIREISKNEPEPAVDFSGSGLIGRSPSMVSVYKLIAFAARSNATVLITGESGTGKELAARAIHDLSDRDHRKFVPVNCSGLTETLLEAELFGYEKGAFTGAQNGRAGLFEAADGGTIFLDELASTSSGFQAGLLRVLQSGEVRRVGATETRQVNVRVIGASNESLNILAEEGQFRADLYYRLSVLTIEMPPLRHRSGDIPLLAGHLLQKNNRHFSVPQLTKEVWDALNQYHFPGNVRELENALIRAAALSTGNVITLDCLPQPIVKFCRSARPADDSPEIIAEFLSDRPSMDELQRRYLCLTLAETNGNRRHAAERLGLDRRTVQRLIARYKLNVASDDAEDGADHELAMDS